MFGQIYVLDDAEHRIFKLNPDLELIGIFQPGTGSPAMTIVKADRSGLPYFLFIFCVVEKSLQPAIRGFPTSYSFEKSETVLTT